MGSVAISVAQLAPRQLEEHVLEVGGPVQVAQGGGVLERLEQARRFGRVAESRLAADFQPIGQPLPRFRQTWKSGSRTPPSRLAQSARLTP